VGRVKDPSMQKAIKGREARCMCIINKGIGGENVFVMSSCFFLGGRGEGGG